MPPLRAEPLEANLSSMDQKPFRLSETSRHRIYTACRIMSFASALILTTTTHNFGVSFLVAAAFFIGGLYVKSTRRW